MSDENQTKKDPIVEVITDTKSENNTSKQPLESLTVFFDDLFNKKLPKLPKGFLDFMVQYMSIFNIIGIVWKGIMILSSVFLLLGSLGLSAFSFLLYDSNIGRVSILSTIIGIVGTAAALYFAIKAHPGLESKKSFGWDNLYYGWLITIITGILTTITSSLNIILIIFMLFTLTFTLLIDALILFLVFQLRSYYNNK